MEPPSGTSAQSGSFGNGDRENLRTRRISHASDDSQTAADFISSQLKLEADAREALPYKFDSCTKPLGSLRQLLFACLTCNPPSISSDEPYTPAAVCYSCSVQCHGEHTLVELFNKRNFVCDCGTSRFPSTTPCALRLNTETNQKGGVVGEEPDPNNKYNHNFQNRFCGCNCDYDADQQKGTMFQCLGLGTAEEGGCGEDWYHPACVVGLDPSWHENQISLKKEKSRSTRPLETIAEDIQISEGNEEEEEQQEEEVEEEMPPPPGFPEEDDFDGFICYKCVEANPWIKRYAGARGFLGPVFKRSAAPSPETPSEVKANPIDAKTAVGIFAAPIPLLPDRTTEEAKHATSLADAQFDLKEDPTQIKSASDAFGLPPPASRKRKVSEESEDVAPLKRSRDDKTDLNQKSISTDTTGTLNKFVPLEGVDSKACKYEMLPPAPQGLVSLFFKSDFREHLCRCSDCFPRLAKHPQLLEEEEAYEPPVSEDGENAEGSTVGSGSLLDRGERALTNMDRVRAIEGVMAYNHLKEKLKPFFKEFAESGKAISAEDIKAHFAKIRGDEEAIRQAGEAAASTGDNRREESGY